MLTDDNLYEIFVAMIRANPNDDNREIEQWLIANLDTFQIVAASTPAIENEDVLVVKDSTNSNDGMEQDELDIPDNVEDQCVKIEEFKSLDPALIDSNPNLCEQFVEQTRKYVWDTGKHINMNTGSCGIAGGVDGSISHNANVNLVSYVYESMRGIAIDFGSGTGYTALLFAASTLYFLYCVEVSNQVIL